MRRFKGCTYWGKWADVATGGVVVPTIQVSIDKPFSQDDTYYVSEWTPKEKLETNIELQEETTQQRMAGAPK